jgi:ribosomal protein L11 methylase PrmA
MTDQPARWIEACEEVVWFPADPGQLTSETIDVIVANLNADALRRLFEAAADEKEEAA